MRSAGGFYIGSVFVGDERITVLPLAIGGTFAMRTRMSDLFVVRVALEGGNQSTHWHERFDLRSYRTVDGDAIAGRDWWTLYGVEVALAYRF